MNMAIKTACREGKTLNQKIGANKKSHYSPRPHLRACRNRRDAMLGARRQTTRAKRKGKKGVIDDRNKQ
jgi:hypothetical protein